MKIRLLVACSLAINCSSPPATKTLTAYRFEGSRTALGLRSDATTIATSKLADGEKIESIRTFVAPGIGETVVEVVANTDDDSRAFVIDEDDVEQTSQDFWTRERAARRQRFGLMAPSLFSDQAQLPEEASTEVLMMVSTDIPEPQLPYDGTDQLVDVDDYLSWFTDHARLAEALVANDKAPIRAWSSLFSCVNA